MKTCSTSNPLALLGLILFSGCAPTATPVDKAVLTETIKKDRETLHQSVPQVQGPMKIEDVLARSLQHNLDTKVSELDALIAADDVTLQMLNTLPSINARVQRQGRNNEGGSSSFSVLTNTESLQPSISQEQYRNVVQLTTEWNLLDMGINFWRGKSATDQMLIAQERRRKVYQGVVQDTYIAFWRAAVAQEALPQLSSLLNDVEEQLSNNALQRKMGVTPVGETQARKSQLLDRKAQLTRLKNGLSLASLELKTLIAMPLNQDLRLDLQGQDPLEASQLPALNGNIENYELQALKSRPEVREEILNKRISARDIKLSIAETIPGAEILLTYNYDSNKFLVFNNWVDGIAGLTSSINRIITAPARHQRAQNVDLLADKRRQALIAAIITQVHVSKARYESLSGDYVGQTEMVDHSNDILKRARDYNETGLMSKAELLDRKIDSNTAAINRAFAYVEAQDAYARFINTLGIDLWDENSSNLSLDDYAKQIRSRLNTSGIMAIPDENNGSVLQ